MNFEAHNLVLEAVTGFNRQCVSVPKYPTDQHGQPDFSRSYWHNNASHHFNNGLVNNGLVSPAVVLTATLCLSSMAAMAEGGGPDTQYNFNLPEINSLQFSRAPEPTSDRAGEQGTEVQTELLFKLSPGKFEFSPAGAFGLSGVFANPELAVRSKPISVLNLHRSVPELHKGLSYSAGIKIEQEDENITDTAYVSSGQLGISYGRLGRVWYSGLDVSLGQYADSHPLIETSGVLSFDITTGRRMSWTGVGSQDPLWLLSLEGNFDMQSEKGNKATGGDGDWYLNPSLFWQNPQFTFSAQLQVPMHSDFQRDSAEPDYKLRAVFEKQFR